MRPRGGPNKAEKSPLDSVAEATLTGIVMEFTVPTDWSTRNVKVSPGESVSGVRLTQDTDRAVDDGVPWANTAGLTLKVTREPVWACAGRSASRVRAPMPTARMIADAA